MAIQYDDIIVGAGSSGAVLAARLSEDPARSVLLLEAGPDYLTIEQTPAVLMSTSMRPTGKYDWQWTAELTPGRNGPYPRGKVTGGSSATNGVMAVRGAPADYDEWAALGNLAWSWQDVLPHFRRLEDDPEQAGDFHGVGGPIPIQRWRAVELQPESHAFVAACRRLGFPETDDHNHPDSTGVGPMPMNRRGDVRVSTATGYLLPARGRLNLTIRADCLVHRVLFEGRHAIGVEVECGGETQRVYGRRITLSAGAVASPAILMRSGIGPAGDLRALGIAPLIDLPGVGENLLDHPTLILLVLPKPGACDPRAVVAGLVLRATAPDSEETNDLHLIMVNNTDLRQLAPEAAETLGVSVAMTMLIGLVRPRSRGRFRLTSADPHEPPRIELNLADDPEDMRRLIAALRLGLQLWRAPEMAPYVERVLAPPDEVVNSDKALAAFIRANLNHYAHAVGTAKMGPASDPLAVVDQEGRVYGVDGLRVVDASIMPTIPRANTNLTCIMIGERVADWMRKEQTGAIAGATAAGIA